MKNKCTCHGAAVLAALVSVLLAACASKPPVYVPSDFTDEKILELEIASIQKMAEKEPVKALWRSKLLCETVADTEELYQQMLSGVLSLFETVVSERKWTEALTVFYSLAALESAPQGWSLERLYGMQNFLGETDEEGETDSVTPDSPPPETAKVSEMIRGTVTIWVDRGIRIQQGTGIPDRVIGSGFFIDKQGYIVTNYHVISSEVDPAYEGYSRLYVRLADDPDTRIPARVVGWDPVFDLALLKAEVEAPYVFTLGSSTDLGVGDRIYAIGSPVGLDKTLTSGIVSAVNRKLFSLGGVLQIDAAINSGNSGGPIIDQNGAVQAIVFAGIESYEGLNFAIPVEYLLLELNRLYEGGKISHGWAGSFGNTRKDAGAEILYVMPGGNASRAGMSPESVIVAVDGEPVSSIEEVQRRLLIRMPGTIVRFTCVPPEGETTERFVYLEPRPRNPGFDIYQRDLPENYFIPIFGMSLVQASSGIRKTYAITSLIKGGVADESGFSVGDPIRIEKMRISPEEDAMMVEIYTKKRKNGFLNVWLTIGAYLDNPGYF